MRSLTTKLAVAFVGVGLIAISLIGLYVWQMTTREFSTFMVAHQRDMLVEQWAQYYAAKGSWEGIQQDMEARRQQRWRLTPDAPPPDAAGPQREPRDWFERSPVAVVDTERRVVLAGRGYREGEIIDRREYVKGVLIEVDGKEVGRLILGFRPSIGVTPWRRFLDQFNNGLLIGGGAAILVALVLGVLLSRSLTRPLHELIAATEAVSQGDLDQRIAVRTRDELGALAESFNRMSARLAESQALRRQMTADIAHELRTPLSLIVGHAEAVVDGVFEPTRERFEIVYDEAQRLTRLVQDLRTLTLSDAGELSLFLDVIPPGALLEAAANAHRPLAETRDIALIVEADDDLADVLADGDRILQVLHNLLSNALRYTPDGGRIRLSARSHTDGVEFRVCDSGPGIASEDIDHVFHRFYKGDRSRQRETDRGYADPRQGESGSGLGLAIARSIVEAHGGHIWAESLDGEGAVFVFILMPEA